jgi:hypothetical protein
MLPATTAALLQNKNANVGPVSQNKRKMQKQKAHKWQMEANTFSNDDGTVTHRP